LSDPKRGGSRDISELKQRLGLKKAAPPGASQPRGTSTTGGLLPPPGMNLPAPPAAPPQPVIPNAAEDPFGAMNAIAAAGTVQRAPEIIIVNDGKPVEQVGGSTRGIQIAKIAVPAVVALAVGLAIGQAAKGANLYNAGLKDSRAILGDDKVPSTVKYLKRGLSELDGVLDEMKTKNDYKPDAAAEKKLTDLLAGKLDVKPAAVFHTASALDPDVTGLIMSFYAGVAEVRGMLASHLNAAKFDVQALNAAQTATSAATVNETENAGLAGIGAVRYGALVQAPSDADKNADFGIKLVELGQPYCGTQISTTGRCDKDQPSGFAYRADPGTQWKQGDLQTSGSDSVPSKKLLLLVPSATRDLLIKGSQPGASEVLYVKRLKAVAEREKKLIEEANKLEQRLQAESNKSSRFTFFL
jgi:hypothetical protein